MLRILVVEDDSDKLRRVLEALKEVNGCEANSIDNVRDGAAARRCLKDTQYDLLVLDISLPEKSDEIPAPDGGITLLEELVQRDIYCKPSHIVGLTAYSSILEQAGPRFEEDLWLVILYEPNSDAWLIQLRNKIRHILLAERSGIGIQEYEAYLCIVTALVDPELNAVLELPWNWELIERPNDPTPYYEGWFFTLQHKRSTLSSSGQKVPPREGAYSESA